MPRNLWNQKVNYKVHKTSQPCQSHPLSSIAVLILCLISCLRLPMGFSASYFSISKACKHPCVLHTPPIACPFISSNLVNDTNQQSSTLCSSSQPPATSSLARRTQNFSHHLVIGHPQPISFSQCEKMFHTTTEQTSKILISTFLERRQKDSKITNRIAVSIP
jgi:hypothetical protein